MKRNLIVIILLICSTLLAQPKIKFDKLIHDFGRIKEAGGPHLTEFKFSNDGDEPLKLTDIVPG